MADFIQVPEPPIRSPFFDFIGNKGAILRRQLGQISRPWLIFFQELAGDVSDLATAVSGGAGASGAYQLEELDL